MQVTADFQSMEFSKRAEILLSSRENVALKLNRQLRLSNLALSKIPPARKIPLTGNWPYKNRSCLMDHATSYGGPIQRLKQLSIAEMIT